MNKNAIQKFAIWARNELIAQVSQRAYQYGIDESGFGDASADALNGRLLTAEEKSQRQELIKQIKEKGYKQVMEEVAYTWFNRFIALRFMEVNNYLPSHIRVFSDASGAFKPEILNDVLHLDLPGLDSSKVAEYIENNDTEALYRYLLLTQCNALNSALPVMFERMGGYTEMLLPNNILHQDSVLGHMVSDISEEDWQDAVQIIGWLYQFYNTELKAEVFGKKEKITKNEIPAATQLFTPDWIVRYMVENSLGKLWLEGHPKAELHDGWKYYLNEAEQEPEVDAQLVKLREEYKTIKPEEIKVIDPCMGSGHILVYAFDVLMQIYTSAGWDQREAAQSILKNNLYGLDIDDRAAQLAYFAVMMKARQYDRRILTRGIQPHVLAIQESNGIHRAHLDYFGAGMSKLEKNTARMQMENLLETLRDAKEYGSILRVEDCDWELLRRFVAGIDVVSQITLDSIGVEDTAERLMRLIDVGQALAQKYDVVVTNPPYMGASGMGAKLSEFVKKNYPDSKSDMFSCFIEHGFQLANVRGFVSMITMESWMFLSSFEKMRQNIVNTHTIVNMVHMPYLGKGGTSLGINFGTAAVIFNKRFWKDFNSQFDYICYYETDNEGVPFAFPTVNERYKATKVSNFSKIPGSPVAYWVSETVVQIFANNKNIDEIAFPRQGLATGNNEQYLRSWPEISYQDIMRNAKSHEEFFQSNKKYIPYNKGGAFRKWLAHIEWLIRFDKPNYDVLQTVGNHLPSKDFYFRDSITWSKVTSGGLSMRYVPNGSVFDVAGCSIFADENLYYLLAFTNTVIMQYLMNVLSQTLNYEVGNVKSIPIVIDNCNKNTVEKIANQNLRLSFADESSYETSWDFKRHPLV